MSKYLFLSNKLIKGSRKLEQFVKLIIPNNDIFIVI